jgi:hypothetical protein
MQRLRSDFWVAAYLRRCSVEGAFAALRRRGASDAGAIWIIVERSDRSVALFGPAPQSLMTAEQMDRTFVSVFADIWRDREQVEARIQREILFDPDLFVIEVEDMQGRIFFESLENIKTV